MNFVFLERMTRDARGGARSSIKPFPYALGRLELERSEQLLGHADVFRAVDADAPVGG
jgi:hypothetical protein